MLLRDGGTCNFQQNNKIYAYSEMRVHVVFSKVMKFTEPWGPWPISTTTFYSHFSDIYRKYNHGSHQQLQERISIISTSFFNFQFFYSSSNLLMQLVQALLLFLDC